MWILAENRQTLFLQVFDVVTGGEKLLVDQGKFRWLGGIRLGYVDSDDDFVFCPCFVVFLFVCRDLRDVLEM